jgi:ABC-2 type transport system ATP-binding protein
MRALVKRLAGSGLTVLLSSHDMDEVEEICDNVTIMSRGSVAFHGTISELRTMAPDPGHALSTTDDALALGVAGYYSAVSVANAPDGGLVVTGPRSDVSAYVSGLVRADIDLLAFTPTETPLEALFFMLTDSADDSAPRHLEQVR